MEKDININFAKSEIFQEIVKLIQDNLDESESSESEFEEYYPREAGERIDYAQTRWSQMLRHPDIENPNSKISKFFQLRFRVPYLLFKHYLVPKCESLNIFGIKHVVNSKCPIELKIMCCLRILGRGLVYDDILEMSQITLSTIPYYLHTFCENITALLYGSVI